MATTSPTSAAPTVASSGKDGADHDALLATSEQLKGIAEDGELTMRFVMGLWDCMTHCNEPDMYHETTKKLQDALDHEASKKPPIATTMQPVEAAKPRSAKDNDWEGLGVYQIQFTADGTPIPDSEWPITSRFVQGTLEDGSTYFQLFASEDASLVVDTTDPARHELFLPGLKDGSYLVYKIGNKYRSGPAVYDAEGKLVHEDFNPGLTFDFAEHQFMGNKVMLTLPEYTEPQQAKDIKFRLGNNLDLTYGEINALGGDFFGTFTPIMRGKNFDEQCDLFQKAYATLADAPGGFTAANKIQDIMKDEVAELGAATDFGNKTADTLELYRKMKASKKALSDEDKALNDATGGTSMPSYLALAQLNLDHFGQGAVAAYNAGHYLAMQEASKGDLVKAYTMNAFADHYLGDCFSSGHFRTPRASLHGGDDGVQAAIDRIVAIAASSTIAGMIAQIALEILDPRSSLILTLKQLAPDLCAKYMHDEDNILGLWLKNTRGDTWQAFGDALLFEDRNKLNAKFMQQALQVSADEVWKAHEQYKDKTIPLPDSGSTDLYLAWRIAPSEEMTSKNHGPLFDVKGNRRSPWTDPTSHKTSWFGSYMQWAIEFTKSDYFAQLK